MFTFFCILLNVFEVSFGSFVGKTKLKRIMSGNFASPNQFHCDLTVLLTQCGHIGGIRNTLFKTFWGLFSQLLLWLEVVFNVGVFH